MWPISAGGGAKSYTYMIVLDADSIMSGATIVRMVEIMEQHPDVGILQTAPKGIGRETLIARMQQFANNVYGPIFTVGLSFWQLGDAHFWGHNAILRVEPFMKHCALPSLPGKPPLGGDIMSHDFVEAALMRRGGWAVWLAFDLEGSYEEMPPTLLDELKRDRRWCQGNMQHLRLLFTKGLCPVHRALFLNGAFSYISALLWFFFLTLCTGAAMYQALHKPDYFPPERSLFPNWPVWHPEWSIGLLAFTAVILFLPKGLAIRAYSSAKGPGQTLWRRAQAHHKRHHGSAVLDPACACADAVSQQIRIYHHARAAGRLGRAAARRPRDSLGRRAAVS